MGTIDTALSPREILNRIYYRLRAAYSNVLSSQPGDVKADEVLVAEIDSMETLMAKLSYSMIRKLRDDAELDAKSFEKLQEIAKMLDDISRGKVADIHEDHYIHRVAKHLRNALRRKAAKTQRLGTVKFQKIQKEKKILVTEEKEARENMGKK